MTVPEGWYQSTLEMCCEILDNRRIPLNQEERNQRKGAYPYYGANGILDYINDYLYNEPLILMAEDGGYFNEARTRPICQLVDGKIWVNNHAHVLRVYDKHSREWVYYWFVHRDITPFVGGGTRSKLNQKALRELPILLPPLPEQKKIAEILGSVDEAIQATQETIEQTKRVKKGLLQDLMPNDQDCKLHFERILLDHVATRGTGHTPNKKKTEYWNGGVKWVSLSDSPALDNVYIYETEKEISKIGLQNSSAVLHPAGTVVLSRDAGVGKSAILGKDMAVSQHFVVWRCGPEISRLYLYYWLQSKKKNFERIAVGSTIKTIGMPYFRKLSIPLPPLDDQIHTAQILHQSDKTITSLEVVKKHYVIAKHGLMQDLLTGEVRVC